MNERFRVRAWDTARREYFREIDTSGVRGWWLNTGKNDFVIFYWEDGKTERFDHARFLFELCTGLKDRNGKLIYEGDVVTFGDISGEVKQLDGGAWYVNHPRVSLKYKHQIHCEVCDTSSPIFFLYSHNGWELEITGNTHENPEMPPRDIAAGSIVDDILAIKGLAYDIQQEGGSGEH